MPPHCDSLDGPVVQAAARAIDNDDVNLVLPYVKADGEDEVRDAFALAMKARTQGEEAREVADRLFFETVVRVHRAGEGAPFTGLKPSGLDRGPVIPVAEAAIASGEPSELVQVLSGEVERQVHARFQRMLRAREEASADPSVASDRRYVEEVLGLQVWSHKLYQHMQAPAHAVRRA